MSSRSGLLRLSVFLTVLLFAARVGAAAQGRAPDAEWEELQQLLDVNGRAGPAGVMGMTRLQQSEWTEEQDRAIIAGTESFLTRYPADPRRWTAVVAAAERQPKFAAGFALLADARNVEPVGVDQTLLADWKQRRAELLRRLLASEDASELERAQANFRLLILDTGKIAGVGPDEIGQLLAELRRRFDDHVQRFGQVWKEQRPVIGSNVTLYLYQIGQELGHRDARLEAEVRHLAQSSHPGVVAAAERRLLTLHQARATRLQGQAQVDARCAYLQEYAAWLARHQRVTLKDGVTPLAMDEFPQTCSVVERTVPEFFLEFLASVAQSGIPRVSDYAAERRKSALQRLATAAKPIELAFIAVDGRPVDLQALRGKVVLIDFWATWCGPCIAELPNIKKVYAAYHDRGFEIIGIALEHAQLAASDTPEQTASKLEKAIKVLNDFTAKAEMPWPQFFDGQRMKNPITQRFGITSIPAMFLLDREGLLVSTNARGEKLEAEVKRLLGL